MFKPIGTKTLYLPWQDPVHTDQFTPKSFQVELLEKAILGNRVVCINAEKGMIMYSLLNYVFIIYRIQDFKSNHS